MRFRNISPLIILFTILFGVLIGTQIQKFFIGNGSNGELSKIDDVISLTKKFYIEELSTEKLVESAIKGILDSLDPHSIYIPAKEFNQVEESFRGDFEGIGIEFQIVNDTITVVTPISGGPSEQLGILPGDRIIEINNQPVIGITNEEVRQKLRGKAGTKVSVKILRPSSGKIFSYSITRDKIPIYSVDAAIMINNNTAYISISRFSETTYDEFIQALDRLNQAGMKYLILDLRGNPGGYLNQAVKISDVFLDGNKKIVYTRGRISEFDEEYFAENTYTYEKLPVVVLINKGSASASEIVAGAIQDWDRGLIVGETSFGKGLVQRQFELRDRSAFRLTISEYFTPSGRNIQRKFADKTNKMEYYSEAFDKQEIEGDNFLHQNESDSLKPEFLTLIKKRKVFGGGGITPDFIVKNSQLTELTQELLKENVFYSFTLNFLDVNGDKIKSDFNNDLKKFKKDFVVSDTIFDNFIKFIRAKNIKLNEQELNKDVSYIKTRLKAQIARNFWKNEGWFSIMLEADEQFKEGLKLLNFAEKMIR
ncbi:MAG: S41 family peptidase [Ignavibacterium sp.]|nr:S41 family peptidase [Ignavibacterium sp.]MCX7611427.1 S41 family peptidase [Ignavibacterium sp.]MDW8376377.1 S41 family peptidase [Ignavibacteriales bacterium]